MIWLRETNFSLLAHYHRLLKNSYTVCTYQCKKLYCAICSPSKEHTRPTIILENIYDRLPSSDVHLIPFLYLTRSDKPVLLFIAI